MKRILFLLTLLGALTACEPTERTNPEAKHPRTPAQPAEAPAEQPTPPPPSVETPEAETPAPPQQPKDEPKPEAEPTPAHHPALSVLVIRATQQDYSPLLPWEKQRPSDDSSLGVYLGEGRVLTLARPLRAATYIELSPPDESRSVPARVLRRDDDLNLALVTVEHEADADLFKDIPPLALGAPLAQGEEAGVAGFVDGLTPFLIPGSVQGSTNGLPRQNLRTTAPVPDGNEDGVPLVREGKLAGIADSSDDSSQTVRVINAELIERFLKDNHVCGTPLLGLQFTELNDPVLRRYLELPEGQAGLYVSKVIPGGAAAAAGLQDGDVITAMEEMPIDSRGRVNHPLYGPIDAGSALRILKPLGETLTFTLFRNGEQVKLPVALNRDITDTPLRRELTPGEAPRYILWGGLLFQPLTQTYFNALRSSSHGELPLSFLRLQQQDKELTEQGIREVVALTLIIPTPATLGYEESRFSVVKAVNGKPVHDFAEFEQLLDEPTEDNITSVTIDRAPYTLHIDRSAAESANDLIRRRGIPTLRVTK